VKLTLWLRRNGWLRPEPGALPSTTTVDPLASGPPNVLGREFGHRGHRAQPFVSPAVDAIFLDDAGPLSRDRSYRQATGELLIVEIERSALVELDSLCSPDLDADDRASLLAWSAWARRESRE